MRNRIQSVLKNYFCSCLILNRKSLGISQEEMAHRLSMATRSYIDLEHGDTCCSAVTLVLYLIYICPEPTTFLDELLCAVERIREVA